MEFQIRRSLEQLLQEWNPLLAIRELNLPDVDSVTYKGVHLCCIPKGGKHRNWYDMMADAVRSQGEKTHDGIEHRTMLGLVELLITKGIITWNSAKGIEANIHSLKKDM